MQIDKALIKDLNMATYNPRVDLQPGDAEFEKLKRSIKHFGYIDPIIVNKRNMVVVGGHQRLKVLKELGYTDIEVVYVDLNGTEEKALNIALNKISGDWDAEKLEDLLRDISLDTDFDIELTGFDLPEVDTLFSGALDNKVEDTVKDINDTIKEERKNKAGGLIEKCGGICPPFSILDASSKRWQDRKKEWINTMGIKSEVGRDAVVIKNGGLEFANLSDKQMNYTSIFDPVLCELMYKWFNIKNGTILDPFAGGSVRGIVASELGYKYTGIELRSEQVDANIDNYKDVCNNEKYLEAPRNNDYIAVDPKWICDDSRNMDSHVKNDSFDMIFTCPPYADLEVYSDDERDISNKEYEEFIKLYSDILYKASKKLKNNRFFVLVIGEVRGNNKKYNSSYYGFIPDTIKIMTDKCGLKFYDDIILSTPAGTLMLTCGRAFNNYRKIGHKHQNILVFYKGEDFHNIKNDFGSIIDENEINNTTNATDGGDDNA